MSLARALDRNEDLLLARAVRSANAAEAIVQAVWAELLRVIRVGGPWFVVYLRAQLVLRRLGPLLAARLAEDLATIAAESHDDTAQTLAGEMPERRSHRGEALLALLLIPLADPIVQRLINGRGLGPAGLMSRVAAVVPPDLLAAQVATAVQTGRSEREVASLILPAVQGVQTVARRLVRTEAIRIGHDSQGEVYERLGEAVEGYTVLSVRDEKVRPAHRRRHGWRYYRRPEAWQRGFDQMPRPPFESQRDGFRLAWNCRCYLRPIFGAWWQALS